jgi:hypothetical protein
MGAPQRLLNAIVRYVRTWQIILLRPDEFVRMPLDKRKQAYTSPYPFLYASAIILAYLTTCGAWLLARLTATPAPPFDPRSLVEPSSFSLVLPQLVSTGIQAFLWFAVMHKWLGHRMLVRTSTPFRRIFQELLYVNAPITLLNLVSFLVGLFCWAIITGVMVPIVTALDSGATIWLAGLIVIAYVLATLLLLVGPWIIPGVYYNSLIAISLFGLGKTRARKLCLVISFVSALPIVIFGILSKTTIPTQLSGQENQALEDLRCVTAVEKYHWKKEGVVLPLSEIKDYVQSIPGDDTWRKTHSKEIQKVSGFISDRRDGYRFFLEPDRRAGLVQAVPEKYGGFTTHSFAAQIEGTQVYLGDKGGGVATSTDRRLVLAPGW